MDFPLDYQQRSPILSTKQLFILYSWILANGIHLAANKTNCLIATYTQQSVGGTIVAVLAVLELLVGWPLPLSANLQVNCRPPAPGLYCFGELFWGVRGSGSINPLLKRHYSTSSRVSNWTVKGGKRPFELAGMRLACFTALLFYRHRSIPTPSEGLDTLGFVLRSRIILGTT